MYKTSMCTRPNVKSSEESLRHLIKRCKTKLCKNRRAADDTAVLKTKFSKLDSQATLQIKELGVSKGKLFISLLRNVNGTAFASGSNLAN
ncbi:hypothetical protein MKX03_001272 [Papaver bracteatum]|nr:hypothetical protein MKX03_001272 [Papaver bracteatum]